MKKLSFKKGLALITASLTMASMLLGGCGAKEDASDKKVLRVGMECAYAPFNCSRSMRRASETARA